MKNTQQPSQSADQLYFDGSAEPNPGGRMGAGWRVVYTDRPEETGSAEWPAAREDSNNRAEYLALIGALEQYLASGRTGPLQVQGDSQLVIHQMTGVWGINNPALGQLNRQATALAKRVSGGVRYRWIPREENQVADTLAGGQQALAATPLVFAEQPGGAAVAAALAEQIVRLNQVGKMSFKEALGLRVGGMDQEERWHLLELVPAVGTAGVALTRAAFPGQDEEAIKARETALRSHGAGAGGAAGYPQGPGRPGAAGVPATTGVGVSGFLVYKSKAAVLWIPLCWGFAIPSGSDRKRGTRRWRGPITF